VVDTLIPHLHELLISAGALRTDDSALFGPSWQALYGKNPVSLREPWWTKERARLLEIAHPSPIGRGAGGEGSAELNRPDSPESLPALRAPRSSPARDGGPPEVRGSKATTPRYAYHLPTIRERARALRALSAVDRIYYAMKANAHPAILRAVAEEGLGFECVSPGELAAVDGIREAGAVPRLFTPNFAPRDDYAYAHRQGVPTTLDALHPLQSWPELFANREIMLRVDLGRGLGHHEKVRTGGATSKFGLPLDQLDAFVALARKNGTRIVGLHAHLGSGILEANHWAEVYGQLASLADKVGSVAYLNLGGGLGVPSHPGEAELDLAALDAALNEVRQAYPQYRLWLEPGRWLVADAGVLLARATQVKRKGALNYLGCDAGMHALIRPALYEAWHEIVNLSRLDAEATTLYQVVGPICESGDVLGADRRLPETAEGDVLLVARAGAYGESMSSHYNLRGLAPSVVIE
jgi:diaminopimelate decarboxylase/aspartate kinase